MIILAPHADDELIGCWSYLQTGKVTDVIYFFDMTPERIAEAQNVAEAFSFNMHLADNVPSYLEDLIPTTTVLAPALTDAHPDHKAVNRLARSHYNKGELLFYSVDLNGPNKSVLDPKDQKAKLEALNHFYPSQASLWDADASYWLFESVVVNDYDTFFKRQVYLNGTWVDIRVNASLGSAAEVGNFLSPRELINHIVAQGATKFSFEYAGVQYSIL